MANTTTDVNVRVLNHMMKRELGVERSLTLEEASRLREAVLAIAKGDGEISDAERLTFLSVARQRGVDDDSLGHLASTKPSKDVLETIDDDTMRPLARALIYDAFRVAGADGVAPGEEKLAVDTAAVLGVDDETVGKIQELLRREAELRKERIALIGPALVDNVL